MTIETWTEQEKKHESDISFLRIPKIAERFSAQIVADLPSNSDDINIFNDNLNQTIRNTSAALLPKTTVRAREPWISRTTIELIE